ncbi:hypothetical protein BGW38_006296 [Lunasporangiospora selenospora]|uniref:SAP domain-containing protein n=1 Tax=Lunasporangiospora selenospora TaxID=979761 RepID=A0A9P6FMT2_9FUNG|nr:hypothetical protein BGW38_006296 [Lunasporangiospora selenospora]
MIDPNSLKVTELKAELTARGLPTKGLKKELVARLEEALAADAAGETTVAEPKLQPELLATNLVEDTVTNDQDATLTTATIPTTTSEEAATIAKIVDPIPEPTSETAEPDVIMAATPDAPASAEESVLVTEPTVELVPVVGTPTLSQEGLVDTTTTTTTPMVGSDTKEMQVDNTEDKSHPGSGKKRTRDSDESEDQPSSSEQKPSSSTSQLATSSGSHDASSPRGESAKRFRSQENERETVISSTPTTTVMATMTITETEDLRRSSAPSPSPTPRSVQMSTPVSVFSTTESGLASSQSPSEERDRKGAGGSTRPERRIDARSLMEKQIRMAANDRKPDSPTSSRPPAVPAEMTTTTTRDSPNDADMEDSKQDSASVAPLPATTTRSLAITNFVRPLIVNQAKRMLAEFGEVETFWMDNIRTHCYVIFKEVSEAEKAYGQVHGQIYPKETGRVLEAFFITPEQAQESIEAAENAQKNKQKPVIFTGKEPLPPKRGASISIRKDDIEVIFKRNNVEPAQLVQPMDLFKMTKAQPPLYFKPAKEPPSPPVLSEAKLSPEDSLPAATVI